MKWVRPCIVVKDRDMPDGDEETVIFIDEIVDVLVEARSRVEVWTNPGPGAYCIVFVYNKKEDAAEAASEIRQAWEEWREKR